MIDWLRKLFGAAAVGTAGGTVGLAAAGGLRPDLIRAIADQGPTVVTLFMLVWLFATYLTRQQDAGERRFSALIEDHRRDRAADREAFTSALDRIMEGVGRLEGAVERLPQRLEASGPYLRGS
jgi:hypothetical protein